MSWIENQDISLAYSKALTKRLPCILPRYQKVNIILSTQTSLSLEFTVSCAEAILMYKGIFCKILAIRR
jgi:hypothetical protein